ncbi:MAG: FMN-binding protein [Clostridiales bacterium]|nr:FMN-binding protein [Clostridiales bacterium]
MKKKGLEALIMAALGVVVIGVSGVIYSTFTTVAAPEGSEQSMSALANVADGTYEAAEMGFGGDVTVQVKVENHVITSIGTDTPSETPELGGAAAPTVAQSIVDAQSLSVDGVSGATLTSNAVLTAVESALAGAGADVDALK